MTDADFATMHALMGDAPALDNEAASRQSLIDARTLIETPTASTLPTWETTMVRTVGEKASCVTLLARPAPANSFGCDGSHNEGPNNEAADPACRPPVRRRTGGRLAYP